MEIMRTKVLVLQEIVPHYRIPFFRSLSVELKSRKLDLCVVSSAILPGPDELGFRHQRTLMTRSGRSALTQIYREQPAVLVLPHSARFAPLASVTRFLQSRGRRQVFWGGGLARRYGVAPTDSQTADQARCYSAISARDRRSAAETARRWMLSLCDHYLSYTEISTQNIIDGGFDKAKITTLDNAIEALATPGQLMAAQRVPGQVLFVATLVEDKEPITAVRIVEKLRLLAPEATLRIVGDGPFRNQCEQAASSRSWVHCHGAQQGQSLRDLALASDIALIPGRVGLAVLEMASAGLPLATRSVAHHGTEIIYLKDKINGLLLDDDIDIAAKELNALLSDRAALESMRNEALSSARKYTVRNMAVNFANGVVSSL